jgi:peptidoglycan hydrolase-like protein with peptidoglycan-binding domain
VGGIVGGVFLYDSPSRDGSLPEGVRASVPEQSSSGSPSSGNPAPTSPSPERSLTPASSPAASPAESEPPTASQSAVPAGPPSSAGATATPTPAPSGPGEQDPVLRLGDQGPEVAELQLRLRQVGFYGEEADGAYDRGVEGAVRVYQLTRVVVADESGVYGRATRASLESETSQP